MYTHCEQNQFVGESRLEVKSMITQFTSTTMTVWIGKVTVFQNKVHLRYHPVVWLSDDSMGRTEALSVALCPGHEAIPAQRPHP